MTISERIEISDALSNASVSLDNAQVLMQVLIDDYFEKYDPANTKDVSAMRFCFPKMRVFMRMLHDQMGAIESALPSTDWVDGLKCDEA